MPFTEGDTGRILWHSRVSIYINPCTNEDIDRSHIRMVWVGSPKYETILEEKGDFYIMGNRKYNVWSKKLSSK
jgi:hypothetical protein